MNGETEQSPESMKTVDGAELCPKCLGLVFRVDGFCKKCGVRVFPKPDSPLISKEEENAFSRKCQIAAIWCLAIVLTLKIYELIVFSHAFCALALNRAESYSLHMPTVAIPAHYDGERIILDEPFDLPTHAPLMVTVLPAASEPDSDNEDVWLRATASGDALAFLSDPAEDIYTVEDGEAFHDAL